MSKPGYIIVEGRTLDHLRGYVNDAIQNGYRPIGGPFIAHRGRGYSEDDWFAQAMVLEGISP